MPSKAFDYIDVATVPSPSTTPARVDDALSQRSVQVYIAVFATCYTIKYITVVSRLAYDLKALELEFYTDAEDTSAMFKYSRIVFTSWTLEVHSQAQKQDLAREMVHQLKYLRDLNSPGILVQSLRGGEKGLWKVLCRRARAESPLVRRCARRGGRVDHGLGR
jgi:hypothetical protein